MCSTTVLFWELLKQAPEKYHQYCKRIAVKPVGSCNIVNTLDGLGKAGKLPNKSLAIIDGDKRGEYPNCLSLPGELAPEKQVITDLQTLGWANAKLDERFDVGAGSLFKILNDATLLPDHHDWTTYIGYKIRESKDVVWKIMVGSWCKLCLTAEQKEAFIAAIETAISNNS